MTFARQLERLRQAAAVGMPGCPPGKVTVDVRDLRELLHHFDRIDTELRAIHQQAAPLSRALADIAAERRRQVEKEGWTPDSDDRLFNGQLATAAGYYALATGWPHERDIGRGLKPRYWPFNHEWWKPTTARRNLVKAGALIAAEIERIDRAEQEGGAA